MNTLEQLINGMKDCQEREKLNHRAFSKRLGIHESLWHGIRNGEQEPGVKVLKGLAKEFPSTHLLILQWLSSGNGAKE